jgi:phage host-nuclease inhibitor protein Gam
VRNFFVGITPTQNSRHGVKFLIQTWCAQQRDKWPKDGETITIDLDEVQITWQR